MRKRLLNTISTQTVPSDFCALPFLDETSKEICLDASRPDDRARVVSASPSILRNGTPGSRPGTSRLPSGNTVRSGRKGATSAILDFEPEPVPKSVHERIVRGGESRIAAMQLLFQTLGLSRAKMADLLLGRLAGVFDVDLCRLLFVESGHDGPELVHVRCPPLPPLYSPITLPVLED
jgi:hypothetical protein